MNGETDLTALLKTMKPTLNAGDYVFCVVTNLEAINSQDIILLFKEQEGFTVILQKETADQLQLKYSFVAAWITLEVHSSLQAVGLTAAFSTALSNEGISCNVVAAFYHDHIFVAKEDAAKAIKVLHKLSAQ